MDAQPAALARIQVAATLRRMRERAGVTREQVAAELYCTTSKIGDLETGRSRVRPAELEKLLDLYGAAGADREQLIHTARDARSRRRRRSPESSIPLVDQRFFDLESQARKIDFFSPELLPGFLQTDGYAGAIMAWSGASRPDDARRRLALRQSRRANLTRPDGPACWCILGEPALRTNAGGSEVMSEQLRAVARASEDLPNLVVQILPLGAGAHGSMGMTKTFLSFDPPARPILHVDTDVRNVYFDNPAEVECAAHEFDLLKGMALSWQASKSLIERVAQEYEELTRGAPVAQVVHPTTLGERRQLRRDLPR